MIYLTEKQKKTLAFIERFNIENGYSPTFRELGRRFNISFQAAHDRIKALERKGYLKTIPKIRRAIILKNVI